jgi:hypothetical protein
MCALLVGWTNRQLAKPEVTEDDQHDHDDPDDVEDVVHALPPSCLFILVAANPPAYWT